MMYVNKFRWNGINLVFFICYSCCILEDKRIVDPDFFSKGPSSSSAPALSEESVSLGNTTPFHNSGLYKNIQMWWVSRPSLGYSLCAEHLALRLLFAQAETPFNTGLLGDVPSWGWLTSFCSTMTENTWFCSKSYEIFDFKQLEYIVKGTLESAF